MEGTITRIQRLSIHDGPGIRSTVFLKGCNMRCIWCHNPETWNPAPELQQIADKCICCTHCIQACRNQAVSIQENRISIDRSRCNSCGGCAEQCPSGSLTMIGSRVSPEGLFEKIIVDKTFFVNSGGGVTLSGGEPTIQAGFCVEFLKLCRAHGVHTAIETNLDCPESTLDLLIPLIDLWMCDLKIADDQKHIRFTSRSNRRTISNLEYLSRQKAELIVRTPVIPGINDTTDDIAAICSIVSGLDIDFYELLPFHSMGFYKFPTLGLENRMEGKDGINDTRIGELYRTVHKYNIKTKQDGQQI